MVGGLCGVFWWVVLTVWKNGVRYSKLDVMNVKGGQKDANQQNKKPTKNLKTKNNHTHKQ